MFELLWNSVLEPGPRKPLIDPTILPYPRATGKDEVRRYRWIEASLLQPLDHISWVSFRWFDRLVFSPKDPDPASCHASPQ